MGTTVSEETTYFHIQREDTIFAELFVPVCQRSYKPEAFDRKKILDMSLISG
jgi:hypothetical protein